MSKDKTAPELRELAAAREDMAAVALGQTTVPAAEATQGKNLDSVEWYSLTEQLMQTTGWDSPQVRGLFQFYSRSGDAVYFFTAEAKKALEALRQETTEGPNISYLVDGFTADKMPCNFLDCYPLRLKDGSKAVLVQYANPLTELLPTGSSAEYAQPSLSLRQFPTWEDIDLKGARDRVFSLPGDPVFENLLSGDYRSEKTAPQDTSHGLDLDLVTGD